MVPKLGSKRGLYSRNNSFDIYRFFYEYGRFPGHNTIVPVPRAKIPNFIESLDVLSPLAPL